MTRTGFESRPLAFGDGGGVDALTLGHLDGAVKFRGKMQHCFERFELRWLGFADTAVFDNDQNTL